MKRIIIVIVLCFIWNCVFCQERVNRVPILYDSISQQKLTNAIKWTYYSYSGEWHSQKNIRDEGNFSSIQSKTITIDSVKYFVLYVETKQGAYDYPELRIGYHTFNMDELWIFTKDDFNKLFEINNNISVIPYLNTSVLSREREEDDIYNGIKHRFLSDERYIGIYEATDGSIRFTFGWYKYNKKDVIKSMETKYFEVSQEEWMKLYIE